MVLGKDRCTRRNNMFCLFKFRKCEQEIQKLKTDTLRVTPEKFLFPLVYVVP
jgi:hypothetical protein